MNSNPFPKPPPADPLPLEVWLNRTDRAEVGREAFFRGRDSEYDVFRRAVNSLDAGMVGGGTMVFQGAPGAGKSALMAECMEAVRRHSTPEAPWVAVDIKPEALGFADMVVRAIIVAVNEENSRLRETANSTLSRIFKKYLELGRRLLQEIPSRDISVAGISWSKEERPVSAQGLFEHAKPLLGKCRIVVCVDETQNAPVETTARGVMDCLNNPPAGIPLVAAFFGLSDTQAVLRQCGLSRFADERVVNLEPLADDDAANAIRSVFKAYGFSGTLEDISAWVDSLTELSQGWPQHINRVAVAATRVILDHGGRIQGHLLKMALEHGSARKEAYYADRLAAASQDSALYREIALAEQDRPNGISRAQLRSMTARILEVSQTTFDDFLTNALHAGVLMPTKILPDYYQIPIPSFGDYLRALPVSLPESS